MSLELLLSRFLYYVEKGDPLPVAFKKAKEMKGSKVTPNAYEMARLLVLQYFSLKGKSMRKKVRQFLEGKGKIKFPDWAEEELSKLYELDKLKESLKKRNVWFWVNTLKADEDKVLKRLENKILFERDRDIPFLYKVTRGELSKTEEFKRFEVIIQDKGSVSVVVTLNPQRGESIYDMSSAPGIKAALIMVLTDNGVNLTVSDVDLKRLNKEREFLKNVGVNMDKVNIINTDGRVVSFSKKFDKVLLDAPCTSSGMIANEPTVLLRLSKERLLNMSALQKELLKNALSMSNHVVYATCSLFPEEGEEVVQSVNAKVISQRRLIPYIHDTEAFFISELEG